MKNSLLILRLNPINEIEIEVTQPIRRVNCDGSSCIITKSYGRKIFGMWFILKKVIN